MTPHSINLKDAEGELIRSYPPSGETIRLETHSKKVAYINGAAVYRKTFSAEAELPPVEEDHFYIVSAIVATSFPDRTDFIMVNDTTRDENGRIDGNTSWATASNLA